jgi:N-acetylmuramoyl-L-alanine amidase
MNCASLRSRLVSSGLLLGLTATTVVMLPTATAAIAPAAIELAQTSARPTLRLGSSGNTVSELQAMLTLLGYFEAPVDGRYELMTEAAVKAFQVDVGLTDDGIVGPATWAKLLPNPSTEFTPPAVPETPPAEGSTPPEEEENAPIALPVLRQGMVGPAVARVQENLQIRGFYDGAIDGIFGPDTEAAVMEFQASAQLAADGVVGPATWQALFQ